MPIPENIVLQLTRNGGAPQTGGITALNSDVIVLSIQNPAGVAKARYEIYEYPAGYAVPAGWSTAANGAYFAITNNGAAAPSFTLPADVALWGKYMFSLEVNDRRRDGLIAQDLYDERTALQILSTPTGLKDVAFRETNQFDTQRQWTGALKHLLRVAAVAGGLAAPANPGDNFKVAYASAGNLAYGTAVTVEAGGATATFFGKESATAAAPAFVARSGGHGMFSPGANLVGISAAGLEIARFNATGAVPTLQVGPLVSTQTTGIGVAAGRTGDGISHIDFSASNAVADSLRVIRNAGVNGSSQIIHRGTGPLQLQTIDASGVQIATNAIARWNFILTGTLQPVTDGGVNLGDPAARVGAGYFQSFLAIGTDPADTGAIRLSNGAGAGIYGESNPTGTDVQMLVLGSGNAVVLGGDTGNAGAQMRSSSGSGCSMYVNAVLELDVVSGVINAQDNEIRTTGFVAIGTNPATTGGLRLANNVGAVFRNSINTTNVRGINLESTSLQIGQGDADCASVNIVAGTSSSVVIGAATELAISAGLVNAQDNEVRTSGVFTGGNGTASAPTFAFVNDTDCGMYRVTADVIAWSVASTEIFRIRRDGGTVPTLEIAGTGSASSPTITLGEIGTGIYKPAAGKLEMSVASANIITLSNPASANRTLNISHAGSLETSTLSLGAARNNSGITSIDFYAASPGTAYDARIRRNSTANGDFTIDNTGTGSGHLQNATNTRFSWNGTGVSFNGATPIARPDYTLNTFTTDRNLSSSAGIAASEVADVLATLITDLISYGLLL